MVDSLLKNELNQYPAIIKLRPANYHDWSFLLELANEPEVASSSGYLGPIPVEEHKRWFRNKLSDRNCRIMIAMMEGKPVGQIRSDRIDDLEIISIGVTKENRGKGFGALIIRLHCCCPGKYVAFIVKGNNASIGAFASANFRMNGQDEKGRIRMEFEL